MKALLTTILLGALPVLAQAQDTAPAKPAAHAASKPAKAAKPAAKHKAAAAKPAARPASTAKAAESKKKLTADQQKAIEAKTPLEEPDPSIKLSPADLEVAKRVHTGEFPCELGAKVNVRPLGNSGFFLVSSKIHRFRMHPVESRTGAIRLEDPSQGAMWLQLGNKSMLMSQKMGQRIADECQSPEQVTFAEEMKKRPPINILDPQAPSVPAVTALPPPNTPASPATPATPAAPVTAATPPQTPASGTQ